MQKKLHLFNCDHLYELRVIEDLLNSSRPMLHDKLGFDFTVEHHYFSLNEIDELSEKVIPSLKSVKMDFAVFVVHAQESRLSINDGRGYTKVYRALMKATGGKVIIVIGADDNYKNEQEEERSVISPWARRIVCVQFNEEYLDGRKSFVFSWGEKHGQIHVEALMHFFNPDKNGEKFKYQLPIKADPTSKARRKTTAESIPIEAEENKCSSDIGKITQGLAGLGCSVGLEIPSYGLRDRSYKTGGISRAGLTIIGCMVSEEAIDAVIQAVESIRPKLNLHAQPPVMNLSPAKAKHYLERHSLQFCVLVVNGETVKDAYENLPERRNEYEKLFKKAGERVEIMKH